MKKTILESLIGEKVTVVCRDRKETTYHGELLEITKTGPVLKLKEHGREFIEFIPMGNVGIISHKIFSHTKKTIHKSITSSSSIQTSDPKCDHPSDP